MANSLFPAYVVIQYTSPFGTHFMTVPTREWIEDTGAAGGAGLFSAWDASVADADTMINALVDLFEPFFKPTVSFNQYTIYTLEDPDAPAVPRVAKQLTQVGTSVQTAWEKAVETTFTFRTHLFGLRRLVFLDAPCGNNFDKISQFDTSPEALAILDELANEGNGWSARDNGRPVILSQISYTLNEKLRKEYGMT